MINFYLLFVVVPAVAGVDAEKSGQLMTGNDSGSSLHSSRRE